MLTASGGHKESCEEVNTMKTLLTLILSLALLHTPPLLAESAEQQPVQQTAESDPAKKATQNSDDDC